MKNLIRIQSWVVVGGSALLVIKAAAYIATGSNAILSDALESIVNITAGSFALYSLVLSSKPRDKNHPYGHGKIEFLSATFEGSLILMAGMFIVGKAVYNFFYPQQVVSIDLGIYLTAFAGFVNLIMGLVLIKKGKSENSIVMEADGKHLISDAWTTLGLIIGLIALYLTKLDWIDNAIASIFGFVIIVTGIGILKKSIAGIMDEADLKLLEEVIEVVDENRKPNWIDLHNLRVIKFGSILHLDCHLTIPWYINIKEGHQIVDDVEGLVKLHYGKNAEMFIHTDPCREKSCKICTLENCEVRKHPFEKQLKWNVENVLGVVQHEIDMNDKKLDVR